MKITRSECLILVWPVDGTIQPDFFSMDGRRIRSCMPDEVEREVVQARDDGFFPVLVLRYFEAIDLYGPDIPLRRSEYRVLGLDTHRESVDWLLHHPSTDVIAAMSRRLLSMPDRAFSIGLSAWMESDAVASGLRAQLKEGRVETDEIEVSESADELDSTTFDLKWRLDPDIRFRLSFRRRQAGTVAIDLEEPQYLRHARSMVIGGTTLPFADPESDPDAAHPYGFLLNPDSPAERDMIQSLATALSLPDEFQHWGGADSGYRDRVLAVLKSVTEELGRFQQRWISRLSLAGFEDWLNPASRNGRVLAGAARNGAFKDSTASGQHQGKAPILTGHDKPLVVRDISEDANAPLRLIWPASPPQAPVVVVKVGDRPLADVTVSWSDDLRELHVAMPDGGIIEGLPLASSSDWDTRRNQLTIQFPGN